MPRDELVPVSPADADRRAAGTAMERSFAVLAYVASKAGPVSPGAVAEALGLPKPTCYRLIEGLERQGLLSRAFGAKGVTVGPRLTTLAFDVLRAATHAAPRRAILERLAGEVGETCNIGTLSGRQVVYLDRVEATHWPLTLHVSAGAEVPLHCTAIGKLFLAFLPDRQRDALLGQIELEHFTDHTITTADGLAAELARVRAAGVAVDREEYINGVVCLAAPIFDATGQICAAVALQAPTARMPVAEVDRHRQRLLAAARALGDSFAEPAEPAEPARADDGRLTGTA